MHRNGWWSLITPTQDIANRFHEHLMGVFGGFVITESMLSGAAGVLLHVDPTKIFQLDSRTIPPVVYLRDGLLPDELMDVSVNAASLLSQFWSKPLEYMKRFFGSSEGRAGYLAHARVSALEVSFARTKNIPPLDDLMLPLKRGHLLGDGDLQLARDILENAATSISQDIVLTKAGHEAIAWLRVNAPDLLA
jgi:hypothetical protein